MTKVEFVYGKARLSFFNMALAVNGVEQNLFLSLFSACKTFGSCVLLLPDAVVYWLWLFFTGSPLREARLCPSLKCLWITVLIKNYLLDR